MTLFSVIGFSPLIAEGADSPYRVGVSQIEYITDADHRPMWMALFYPTDAKDIEAARL